MTTANDFSIFGSLESHRGRIEQTRENSGRLARSHGTWTTTGSGEMIVPDAFLFGVTFTQQPSVAYGCSMPEIEGESQELVAGSVPRANGGVHRWVRDRNGFYTGANVYFTVDFGYGGVPKVYTIVHSLVFTAVALKDLGKGILENMGTDAPA